MLSSKCAAGGGGQEPQSLYIWQDAAPAYHRLWQASQDTGKFLQPHHLHLSLECC